MHEKWTIPPLPPLPPREGGLRGPLPLVGGA